MTAGGGVGKVDAVSVLRAAAATSVALASSDAYHAERAPLLVAAACAVAELIAADKEYDEARREYDAKAPDGIGEMDSRTAADYARLNAATARRASALAALEEHP